MSTIFRKISYRLGDENIEDFEFPTNGTCAATMENQMDMYIDSVDEARNWEPMCVENLETNDTEWMYEHYLVMFFSR